MKKTHVTYRELIGLIRALDAYHDLAQEMGRDNPLYQSQRVWYDKRTEIAKLIFAERSPKLSELLTPELEKIYNQLRKDYVECEEEVLVTA